MRNVTYGSERIQKEPNDPERKESDGEEFDSGGGGGYLARMGKEIVGWLKDARARQGLSQSEAAKKWGVNLRTLQGWEVGRSYPIGKTLLRLMREIGPPEVRPVRRKRGA